MKTPVRFRIITVVALLLLPWSSWGSVSAPYSPYDGYFRLYSARWLPEYDYRHLIAQCRQESGPKFNTFARSPANAVGVCQFMRPTWMDAQLALGFISSRTSAKHNIKAAAWYMSRLSRIWIIKRPKLERLYLAQASYNAGAGNIIKAQRLCDEARLWNQIKPCLIQVTGRHSAETLTYVERIKKWYLRLVNGSGSSCTVRSCWARYEPIP